MWIPYEQQETIREVQERCADIAERGDDWTEEEAAEIGSLFARAEHPMWFFRFVDEKTGHFMVGYETKDGREWFHILRQMRNSSKAFFNAMGIEV